MLNKLNLLYQRAHRRRYLISQFKVFEIGKKELFNYILNSKNDDERRLIAMVKSFVAGLDTTYKYEKFRMVYRKLLITNKQQFYALRELSDDKLANLFCDFRLFVLPYLNKIVDFAIAYCNLETAKNIALELDMELKKNIHSDWRGDQARERTVKNNIYRVIGEQYNFSKEAVYQLFELIKADKTLYDF